MYSCYIYNASALSTWKTLPEMVLWRAHGGEGFPLDRRRSTGSEVDVSWVTSNVESSHIAGGRPRTGPVSPGHDLFWPISSESSSSHSSQASLLPASLRPTQIPAAVAPLASKNQPSNQRSTNAGSKALSRASPTALLTSSGRFDLNKSAALITYVAVICPMRRARFAWA